MDGKVSVIVPVYNAEKYIRRCLESICCQTYKYLEIIIVNDGSSDNSSNICEKYRVSDPRIKLIHQTHLGVASARNVALSEASGKYICFVDSDDYIDNIMIEKMYNLLITYNCDIIQCNYQRVEDICHDILENKTSKYNVRIYSKEDALWSLQAGNYRISMMVWNKLYRRSVWDGITFPDGKIYEDDAVMHRVLFKADNIAVITETFYYQRMSPNSIIRSGFSFNRYHFIDAMIDRYEFFRSMGYTDCAYVTIQKMEVKIIELYRDTIKFYPQELDKLQYLLELYQKYWKILKRSPFLSDELRQRHLHWLDFPEEGAIYEFTHYSCEFERNKD